MTAVTTRPAPLVRLLRLLSCGLVALAAGCSGNTTVVYGTAVVSLSDTNGDFAAYLLSIDSITLTRSDGALIPLLAPQLPLGVDLVRVGAVTELLEAPAVPTGTYTSMSIALDFNANTVFTPGAFVNVNGQAVAATLTAFDGSAPSSTAVTVTFDPANPLVINQGVSTRLAIDIDLTASNSVNAASSPPAVTVQPFAYATPAPVDATVMRARGQLVIAQPGSSNYIMNAQPLADTTLALGAITVNTGPQTYFNVDGVVYTGAAGLTALAADSQGTVTVAYGTLGDLSGITPTFNATAVYAGLSVQSPLADRISGIVSARTGNTLTVHAVHYVSRFGTQSFSTDVTVTIGSGTVVSEDGAAAGSLTAQSVSVGQQVQIFGQAATNSSGIVVTMDATAGQVRLQSTRLWGALNAGATPGNAAVTVLSLDNYEPAAFNFGGTNSGGASADPNAYVVNTGTADESGTATGTLLQMDGFVTPYGSAPPNFTAGLITPGSATPAQLVIEWHGGTTTPFASATGAGLVPELTGSDVGVIRIGPVAMALPANVLIDTANQADLRLAIGSATVTTTGISVFNTFASLLTHVNATFTGTNKLFKLVALGQWDAANSTFTVTRISLALQET